MQHVVKDFNRACSLNLTLQVAAQANQGGVTKLIPSVMSRNVKLSLDNLGFDGLARVGWLLLWNAKLPQKLSKGVFY